MFTKEQHQQHDPEHPELDCSFCVMARRQRAIPLRHGDGYSSRMVPGKASPSDE